MRPDVLKASIYLTLLAILLVVIYGAVMQQKLKQLRTENDRLKKQNRLP